MLHDIIGGHQAYIQRNKYLFNIYGASNFAAGLDHAQLADCTRISRDKIIKSLRFASLEITRLKLTLSLLFYLT